MPMYEVIQERKYYFRQEVEADSIISAIAVAINVDDWEQLPDADQDIDAYEIKEEATSSQ
jgi:hypothetical protein